MEGDVSLVRFLVESYNFHFEFSLAFLTAQQSPNIWNKAWYSSRVICAKSKHTMKVDLIHISFNPDLWLNPVGHYCINCRLILFILNNSSMSTTQMHLVFLSMQWFWRRRSRMSKMLPIWYLGPRLGYLHFVKFRWNPYTAISEKGQCDQNDSGAFSSGLLKRDIFTIWYDPIE